MCAQHADLHLKAAGFGLLQRDHFTAPCAVAVAAAAATAAAAADTADSAAQKSSAKAPLQPCQGSAD